LEDGHFVVTSRVLHPVKQAATLESLVYFACAIGCQEYQRRYLGPYGAVFGNSDAEVGKGFEQIGFEFVVCAINFIYQQNHRTFTKRPEDGSGDKKLLVVQRIVA